MKADVTILASDIGTSSVKTILYRPDGSPVGSSSFAYPTRYDQPGWAEQDPNDWWQAYTRSILELVQCHPREMAAIAVIGLSGQMLGCLPVDAQGRPLYAALIHADARAVAQASQIGQAIGAQTLYERTGNILDARSGLAKLLWFKQHRPEIYRHADRFLQAKDFIAAQLTGQIDATDYADAVHAQWIDLGRKTALADIFAELGLEAGKIPQARPGTALIGSLCGPSAAQLGLAAGIPVVAGSGDGSCAAVGAGAVRPNDVYACLGTTAWISRIAAEPVIDSRQRLFNLVSTDGQSYGVIGTTQNAGQSVRWAMSLFGDASERDFDAQALLAPPGSDNLVFLPYLDGERTPVFDTAARGIFFGISSRHGPCHFRRAVLEGVALALRSITAVLREQGEIGQMRLIGGGARSDLWRAMIAAACRLELIRMATPAGDATALGAALTAGVGVGLYPDLSAAVRVVRQESRDLPDKDWSDCFDHLDRTYAQLYPLNRVLFAKP